MAGRRSPVGGRFSQISKHITSNKKGDGDGSHAKEDGYPTANVPAQYFGAIRPAFVLGIVEAPGMAGALDQLAAGVVVNALEEGRAGGVNQRNRQSRQEVIERRLVGFVAGLLAFLVVQRQAAMIGDEANILIMSQFVGTGGQGSQISMSQGQGEVEEKQES